MNNNKKFPGGLICHHDPSRSFWIHGKPMPLCSRCTGYWFTLVAFSLISIFLKGLTDIPPITMAGYLLIGLTPLAVDGYTQYLGWRESNNIIRLITGIIAGAPAGLTLTYLVKNFLSLIL